MYVYIYVYVYIYLKGFAPCRRPPLWEPHQVSPRQFCAQGGDGQKVEIFMVFVGSWEGQKVWNHEGLRVR